ncbi:MAG: LPS assembly lipoprotein LptE [candidate division WOR-3 bacterium]|nr:LPS assembly lipoprotein LptE [candidate division WOR-3 bacterium]MCX7757446.1 LPS assembly lipoprotein LptE [candidate division WOR-3 bacterium]MDW7988115.1 LPS assembly lipoprotein LptE [candidate division WOR-3 bacterium]
MKSIWNFIWAFIIIGCGYSLKPPILSPYTSVASPVISNRTVKAGLEEILFDELVSCIKSESNLKIVPENKAQLIIECQITNYERTAQTYTADQEVYTYQISINASVTIKDNTTEESKVVYSGNLTGWATYNVNQETEDIGIRKATKKLSQEIVKKVTVSW